MARTGLAEAAHLIHQQFDADKSVLTVERRFYVPGYWTLLAAFARHRGLAKQDIQLNDERIAGYSRAIGLSRALWGEDDYEHERRNEGANYSCLVHLDHPESTDRANETINNCIRTHLLKDDSEGVHELCSVIGDLHDNVWSHGKSSGFSMAQVYPGSSYIEFSLADFGGGFLREMRRAQRTEAENDEQAISWCIQRGNSTKLAEADDDGWAQRLPDDALHNPYGLEIKTRSKENNHQGLGLSKLIDLVEKYDGQLSIVTGTAICSVKDKKTSFQPVPHWNGVAISCTLPVVNLSKPATPVDDATALLMKQLRG